MLTLQALQAVGSDSFFDVSALPTIEIAEKINDDKVHVLVDMDAHFRGSRIQVYEALSYSVRP
jgi:predicted O-linked N-acetylglucosamine transferase (SPINDLY family)